MTYFILFIAVIVVVVSVYITRIVTKAHTITIAQDNLDVLKAIEAADSLIQEIDDALEYGDQFLDDLSKYYDMMQDELDAEESYNNAHEIIMNELQECSDLERIDELLDALNKLEK